MPTMTRGRGRRRAAEHRRLVVLVVLALTASMLVTSAEAPTFTTKISGDVTSNSFTGAGGGLGFKSDNTEVWASTGFNDQIAVLDNTQATLVEVARLTAVGGSPGAGVALCHAGGFFFHQLAFPGPIAVWDEVTRTQVKTITLPGGTAGSGATDGKCYASPDGKTVAVTSVVWPFIGLIDNSGSTPVFKQSITLGSVGERMGYDIAFSNDSMMVYAIIQDKPNKPQIGDNPGATGLALAVAANPAVTGDLPLPAQAAAIVPLPSGDTTASSVFTRGSDDSVIVQLGVARTQATTSKFQRRTKDGKTILAEGSLANSGAADYSSDFGQFALTTNGQIYDISGSLPSLVADVHDLSGATQYHDVKFSADRTLAAVTVNPSAEVQAAVLPCSDVTDCHFRVVVVEGFPGGPIGNAPPVAFDDSYTTAEDIPLNVAAPGVLANDTDVDGDTLTAVLVSGPNQGTVTLNENGSFTYTPAPNFNGTATFTYKAKDPSNAESNVATVTITVTAVNDVPSFTKGPNQTRFEDAGPQTVLSWASNINSGPANESSQILTFIVTNDNNALFSAQPAVSPDGTLTFTSAPNKNGMATVTVKLMDNGGTANGGVDTSAPQTFTITVELVNDAPSFVKGADQTVPEDAGPQTVPNWATSISAGPPEDPLESGQSLMFLVTNDNNALFSQQPAVSPNGTLTYRPADNANGSALVTVQLKDNGPTSPGGPGFSPDQNTSAPQTFTITVTPVNDAPQFDSIADQTVIEPETVVITGVLPGPVTDEGSQTVTLTPTSPDTTLVTNLTITPASAIGVTTRTLSYQRFVNANGTTNAGTATVTVTANDGQSQSNTFSRSFTITLANASTDLTTTVGSTSAPASSTGFVPGEPVVVTATVTFPPIDFNGDGTPDCYFVIPPNPFNVIPRVDGQDADNIPEGPPVTLSDNLPQVCTQPLTLSTNVTLTDWYTDLLTAEGTHNYTLTYVNFARDPELVGNGCAGGAGNCFTILQGTADTSGSVTVGDQCPPPGPGAPNPGGGFGQGAGGTGCPVADKNTVTLHTVNIGGGSSTKVLLGEVVVRVFDRNSPAFRALVATLTGTDPLNPANKNPDGSLYGAIFDANLGVVGTCVTASTPPDAGVCFAGEAQTGDYLVIVKFFDPATKKSVYVGRPKSPSDFVSTPSGLVAEKDFQIIKVFKNGIFQGYRGGSKIVVTGSILEMIVPGSAIWEGTQSIYPFIFTSDTTWTVDVCAQVPAGYQIVGVYDEGGNLIASTNCAQAFVAGQTKVVAFEVVKTGSPEPSLDAEVTVTGPDGKSHKKHVKASDIRRETFDAKLREAKQKKQGAR